METFAVVLDFTPLLFFLSVYTVQEARGKCCMGGSMGVPLAPSTKIRVAAGQRLLGDWGGGAAVTLKAAGPQRPSLTLLPAGAHPIKRRH